MRNFSPIRLGVNFSFYPQAVPSEGRFSGKKGGLLKTFSILLLSTACCFAENNVPLGTAGNFAVLASTTVTNTGTSVIAGDVGVSPGSAITGFPPGVVIPPGTIDAGNGTAAAAHSDLALAYMNASIQPSTQNLPEMVGNMTLAPGVYTFSSDAQLTGRLTLSGAGFYLFKIGTTLTTAHASVVAAINGADAASIFWQVGSSATLGTASTFIGNILANTSITTTTSVTMAGRLLALNGAVTMDTIALTFPPSTIPGGFGGPPLPSPTPAPSSWILVLIGLGCAMLFQTRERWLRRHANR
jgi:hypothetical protein